MTQDEAYQCLLYLFTNAFSKASANDILASEYKTDVDYVLKAAHPETVYGALHAWAQEDQ